MSDATEVPAPPPSAWRTALAAARANLLPGLALQAFAILLVAAYYAWPACRPGFELLAGWKRRYGYGYSLAATALCGGLIPFVYLRLNPATRARTPWSDGVFLLAFWAWKGAEVDALYRLQAAVFGSAPGAGVVAVKVVVDQFAYNPLWAAPSALLCYRWKDQGYPPPSRALAGAGAFLRRSLPAALLSTWAVWVPAVSAIYCLPVTLQIPLFNVVLCFWVLLFTTLTARRGA